MVPSDDAIMDRINPAFGFRVMRCALVRFSTPSTSAVMRKTQARMGALLIVKP